MVSSSDETRATSSPREGGGARVYERPRIYQNRRAMLTIAIGLLMLAASAVFWILVLRN